jgi:putative transposase
MSNSRIIKLKKPSEISEYPLTELLRNGAQQLIADAVETELQGLLNQHIKFRICHGTAEDS